MLVLATGRPRYSIPYEALSECPCYIVSTGGAQISLWHPPSGSSPGHVEELVSHRFTATELTKLVDLADPENCDGYDYTLTGDKYELVCHRQACWDSALVAFGHGFDESRVVLVDTLSREALQRGSLDFNVFTTDPGKWIEKAKEKLPTEMVKGARAVTFLDWSPLPLVSVQCAGADKALALEHICARLQVQLNECIAFGDSVNDIVLLRAAGCGMAVSNAKPQVVSVADVLLPYSNDQHAVAHALLYLHERGQL